MTRTCSVYLLLPFTLALGCSPNVLVEVTGLPADVSSIRIDSMLDGSSFSTIEHPRSDRFVLTLPIGSAGALDVTVSGIGKNGCTVAKGGGRADSVRSSQYYASKLTVPVQAIPPTLCRCGQTSYRFQQVSNNLTGSPSNQIYAGVWGTSDQDVTFFGSSKSILRYSGSKGWTFVPGTGGSNSFQDAHGDGSGQLWGADTSADLYHFDGQTWRTERSGSGANSVWVGAQNNVWTGGDKCVVQRFDGQVWRTVPTPSSCTTSNRSLLRVFGIGETVWAFGDKNSSNGVVLSCSPTGCVEQTPSVNTSISSAWGDSVDNFWAVSPSGKIFQYTPSTQRWDVVQAPVNSGLLDVWGSGRDDIWAVGLVGTILHYDGTGWNQHGQSGTVSSATLESVWGYGCDAFVGGANGTVLRLGLP